MICLHEILDGHLLAGLELEQLEQILGEPLHLGPVGQRQQPLGAHAQDLKEAQTTASDFYYSYYSQVIPGEEATTSFMQVQHYLDLVFPVIMENDYIFCTICLGGQQAMVDGTGKPRKSMYKVMIQ